MTRVHHNDKNRANNDINNLSCLSVQDHFNIHFDMGDLPSCLLIARNIDSVDKTKIARDYQYKLLNKGIHNFQINNKHKPEWFEKIKIRMKSDKNPAKTRNKDFYQSDEFREKQAKGAEGNTNVRGTKWWYKDGKRKRNKTQPGPDWKEGFKVNG